MIDPAPVAAALGAALATELQTAPSARVQGGCINECYRWQSGLGPLFVKVAPARNSWLLEAEADGLRGLESAHAVRVPRILASGSAADQAFLALEWLDLSQPSPAAAAALGSRMAQLHRVTAPAFGWRRDNAIGATPQANGESVDWTVFFRERRLRPQLELAARLGYAGRLQHRGDRLLATLGSRLAGHRPQPALIHGDLWGGNWGVDASGDPVIFDPAVHFADRECELAMTRLFGGFGPSFYAAYEAAWPLDDGASEREPLYRLYHVLNHLNLFGQPYAGQAEALIDRILEG